MLRSGGRAGSRKKVVGMLLLCIVILATPPVGGVMLAQVAPGDRPQDGDQLGGRVSAEMDLVWLLAGLMDVERDRKLAITRDQATQMWPLFVSLVENDLIRLEVDPSQFDAGTRAAPSAQGGPGPAPGDPRKIQEMRAQRDAQEQAIHQVIEQMEKILSPKQIAYVDNFDFDPARYGLAWRGSGQRPVPGQSAGQSAGQGAAPTQQQIDRMRETAMENFRKLAQFYRDFQIFLRKKAGIPG